MKLIALAAAIAMSACVLSVVPAQAQETATISYADLDIATDAGAARLENRIEHAIDLVCARPDPRSAAAMASFTNCATDARAQVQADLSARGIAL